MNIDLMLFLLVNSIIGIMLLFFLKLNIGSVTEKLNLSLFSLFIWVLPYHWLKNIIPTPVELNHFWLEPLTSLENTVDIATVNIGLSSLITLSNLLIILFSIGAILFLKQIISYVKWISKLKQGFTVEKELCFHEGKKYSIYSSTKLENGLITGYFKPIIWINSSLVGTSKYDLIIAHEKQHLLNNDHWKLLLLSFIRSIYWWNPIVLLMIKRIAFLIEVRCDLQTCKSYGKQNYIKELAEIILSSSQLHSHSFVNSIKSHKNINISRLKFLDKKHNMTRNSKFIYSLFSILCVFILSLPIANINAEEQQSISPDTNGLLLDFKIVDSSIDENESKNTTSVVISIWSHFDKPATIKIGETWAMELIMSDHKDEVFLDMKLLEKIDKSLKVVATPKILATIGVKSIIKWKDESHDWEVQVTAHRTPRPISE